jgi:hypothetical protein
MTHGSELERETYIDNPPDSSQGMKLDHHRAVGSGAARGRRSPPTSPNLKSVAYAVLILKTTRL